MHRGEGNIGLALFLVLKPFLLIYVQHSFHSVAWSAVCPDSLALLSNWTALLVDAAAFSRLMSCCTIWRWTTVPSLHLFSKPSGTLFHTKVLWGMVLWNRSQCTSQRYLKTHVSQERPDGWQDRFMGSWTEGGLSSIYPVYPRVRTELPLFH